MPFEIVRNDITRMRVDAIVNAANNTLLGGGGVDGAIHRAAGPELLAECRTLGGCETGEAKLTQGYRLPAKYVIHTVGPVWNGGIYGEKLLLAACYRHSLELAQAHGCESVAFPLISAGVYGYPPDQAMEVARDTIRAFLDEHDDMTVYLVLYGRPEFLTGRQLFRDVQAYIDDVYAETHADRRRLNRPDGPLIGRKYAADVPDIPNSPMPTSAKPKDAAVSGALKDWISVDEDALPDALPFEKTGADAAKMAAPINCPPPGKESSLEDTADYGAPPDWERLLRQTDEGFSEALLRLIDEKGMTDAACYKRANVDRKLFSKIRSNPAYKPSKPTAFAFAVALELNLPETKRLLGRAGFAISHSSKFDIILEYFIKARRYNIDEINEVLFQFDMPLLGSGMN